MPDIPAPAIGTEPPSKKDHEDASYRFTAWLAARWVRTHTGAPAELVTTERMQTVIQAYGYVLQFLKWFFKQILKPNK